MDIAAPPRPRPAAPTARGRRTRARILDAARELFAAAGFHATSLREIAASAGISHTGLLHHYPTKDALLLDLLDRRDELDLSRVVGPDGALVPELVAAGGARAVLDALGRVVARNATQPGVVNLFVKVSAEATDTRHPAHEHFAARYRDVVTLFTIAFGAALADRPAGARTDAPEPAVAARQLVALLDGLQVQWVLDPTIDMVAAVEGYLTTLGVTAPPSPQPDPHPPEDA